MAESYYDQPDVGVFAAGDYLHSMSPNYPDTLFDNPLESEFNRLSLSAPPYSPAFMAASPDAVTVEDGRRSLNGALIGHRRFPSPNEMGHNNLLNHNSSLPRSRYHQKFSSLEDLRGKIYLIAKDQLGCRFLQNKFAEGNPDEIGLMFWELKDHICELMVDQFGNYLIQKLFKVCNEEQMNQLLFLVINDERNFKDICTDIYGCRAVQKLIESLTTREQRSVVITVVRRIAFALTKSMNGHHVIQHCFRLFSSEDNKHILNMIADNCLDIATDKSGCCVLQTCISHAQGEPWERIISDITSNALILSEHPYGNYVVQYILGMGIPHLTADIIAQLRGNYVSLSMNKYGSNVVEKCLRESEGDQVIQIINEIIQSPDFLMVLQDPYGNYVAQCALSISKGAIRHAMVNQILINYAFLHSHPHGKRVLARTKGSKQRI